VIMGPTMEVFVRALGPTMEVFALHRSTSVSAGAHYGHVLVFM